MTEKQLALALAEARNYTDPDAFVSDLLLSSDFLPEEEDAAPDLSLAEDLRQIWTIAAAPFKDLLARMGLNQSACSRRFGVPLRTVQGWALGERECPVYVRRMMAELVGLIR